MLWQPVQRDLGGVRCAAWYLPVWHVRQFLTLLLTALACSFLLWQPLHTNFLVIDEECWAVRPELPLWHCAHLPCATLLPAWRIVWHLPHFL